MKEKLNYTNKEACKALGVSPRTLYNLRRTGKIQSYKIGNRNYFLASELKRFLHRQSQVIRTWS